jgi:hypothetical protein
MAPRCFALAIVALSLAVFTTAVVQIGGNLGWQWVAERIPRFLTGSKGAASDLDVESAYQADGLRVSIQSLRADGATVTVLYRVQLTDPKRKMALRKADQTVYVRFWDGAGAQIAPDVHAWIAFGSEFLDGKPNDDLVEVPRPPGARYVSVEIWSNYRTKRVALEDRDATDESKRIIEDAIQQRRLPRPDQHQEEG